MFDSKNVKFARLLGRGGGGGEGEKSMKGKREIYIIISHSLQYSQSGIGGCQRQQK